LVTQESHWFANPADPELPGARVDNEAMST